jgi:chemotaxis methyl-accepting protein methylase
MLCETWKLTSRLSKFEPRKIMNLSPFENENTTLTTSRMRDQLEKLNVSSYEEYYTLYRQSLNEPDAFWGKVLPLMF